MKSRRGGSLRRLDALEKEWDTGRRSISEIAPCTRWQDFCGNTEIPDDLKEREPQRAALYKATASLGARLRQHRRRTGGRRLHPAEDRPHQAGHRPPCQAARDHPQRQRRKPPSTRRRAAPSTTTSTTTGTWP